MTRGGEDAGLDIHWGRKGSVLLGPPGSTEETEKHLGLAVGQGVLDTHKQKLKMINP